MPNLNYENYQGEYEDKNTKKMYFAGTLFNQPSPKGIIQKAEVIIPAVPETKREPKMERIFLAFIRLVMLSPIPYGEEGAAFDQDDTVFADIWKVDKRRLDPWSRNYGGVWDHHFGERGIESNKQASAYVGPIEGSITFRVFNQGDNRVGASYFVMELGTQAIP